MSLKIPHRFSLLNSAFDPARWVLRTALIIGGNGTPVYRREGVMSPIHWSDRAVAISDSKYCKGGESIRDLVTRVVNTITQAGIASGYFDKANGNIFSAELAEILVSQRASFNSPVWFNVGRVPDPQSSACFILSVEDSMEGIMQLAATEARLFKQGSGCGSNLSKLRSSKDKLSAGGHASGPVSFMRGFDAFAGAIKSGGTTRRAAKMVILNVDHPDVLEFIACKKEAEQDARILCAAGRAPSIDAPRVAFQNANNSVRVTNAFMEAVVTDGQWGLMSGSTGKVVETVSARALFQEIAEAAWDCGDPGMQFDDAANAWHTCPASGRITGSNPCSEYMFLEESACNLASINLMPFIGANGSFDVESFEHTVRIMILAQEILVGLSGYPTDEIAKNSRAYRPLGLGYANLGAVLMRLGVAYDSEEGRTIAASITALMGGVAYAESARIASVMGAFDGYAMNATHMMRVMEMHANAAKGIPSTTGSEQFLSAVKKSWNTALRLGKKHGFRNAQTTVLAPTGTISFMMDCDTTGIEPAFGLVVTKQLVGGGVEVMVNNTVGLALRSLGYRDDAINRIVEHVKTGRPIDEAPGFNPTHQSVFSCAVGNHAITPEGHVLMMAAVQPFLSGAISKTVNMPSDATPDDVARIYLMAWKLGLKAVAIYRDGSKAYQVITTGTKKKTEEVLEPVRHKMPKTRKAITHTFQIEDHKGYIIVGLYDDGTPGEVFIVMSKEGSTIGGVMDCFATAVSMGLQYGVPLEKFVKKFVHSRFEPSGFTKNPEIPIAKSVADYIFRWLAGEFLSPAAAADAGVHNNHDTNEVSEQLLTSPTPLNRGHKSDSPPCARCGSIMTRAGSCYSCPSCGNTTGCS